MPPTPGPTAAVNSTEAYHRGELAISLDTAHAAHILPPTAPTGARILDIGCGAGQTLIAAYPDRTAFGIDVDHSALALGRQWTDHVCFVQGRAESLPLPGAQFDLVISRTSLCYTDLKRSLPEAHRVLRPGGRLWITLHPFGIAWRQVRLASPRSWLYFTYVLLNSALFHYFGHQVRWFGRYESFQTEAGMRRALERCGFAEVRITQGRHFVMEAKAR